MDSGPAPRGASRNDGVYYFFGGAGHGFCGPRRPSNALAMPSTPRASKRRPPICTPSIKTSDDVDARQFGCFFRPVVDIGQRFGALGRRQLGEVIPAPRTPETVESVEHFAGQDAVDLGDDGAGGFERLGRFYDDLANF